MSMSCSGDSPDAQLRERFGLLLTPAQLAELLGLTASGVRSIVAHPKDDQAAALQACVRRIGRRLYFPVSDVAAIVAAARR
jgi:hypothetical protein